MYAVIFKTVIKQFDEQYLAMASRMRELAINEYSCIEFIANTEGNREIAISYWPNKDAIQAWKNNPEHMQAQKLGKSKWYDSYQVQIVEILHEYESEI